MSLPPPGDPASPAEDVTALLEAARQGDVSARDRLFALVYGDLKHVAHRHLASARPGATLQTTTLVHETYLRLARPGASERLQDRVHFFAVASRAMRQIVIDHVRARQAVKRGGEVERLELDEQQIGVLPLAADAELLALDEALTRLERFDARLGQVVELRFFGGLTFEEVGELLEVSDRTVKRDWRKARAFLHAELAGSAAAG